MLTLFRHLQVALYWGVEERLVQFNFSAAFDRVSHCRLLNKLRSIGVVGQFLLVVLNIGVSYRGRLGVPFIHLFVYICWSSGMVALMLC